MRCPRPDGERSYCRCANERTAGLQQRSGTDNFSTMTGLEVIEEIKRLPKEEQTKVIEFARQIADNRRLTPEELGELARQMVEAKDPAEADRLQEKIVRGFYGGESHA